MDNQLKELELEREKISVVNMKVNLHLDVVEATRRNVVELLKLTQEIGAAPISENVLIMTEHTKAAHDLVKAI